MFSGKFTSKKRAAAWMLLAMPVAQVAADACVTGWNGSIYVWPMFGYCIDSANVYWDCHNKCGQNSKITITCSTDCVSKTYAATGQYDCVQDDGHNSCQNRQISAKAKCTVGTSCVPKDHTLKEYCDGNELVPNGAAIGLNKMWGSSEALQTLQMLVEPVTKTSKCWGWGSKQSTSSKKTWVQICDKANGDNNKKVGNILAKYNDEYSVSDFSLMAKYGLVAIRRDVNGPAYVDIDPSKATVNTTPIMQLIGINVIPNEKIALRWVTSDFSWTILACSLDVITDPGGMYPKVAAPYSTTSKITALGVTVQSSCTNAVTCEVVNFSTSVCATATVYSGATCTTTLNGTKFSTTVTYTPNADHTNLMFRFTLTTNLSQKVCSSSYAATSSQISLLACGVAGHTITATGSTISQVYDGTTVKATYDYSSWFTLSEPACQIEQIYFSNSNTSPTNDAITGAAMVAGTTTFTLDYPVMYTDASVPVGLKTFYLIAKYTQSGNFAAIRIDADKIKCWSTSGQVVNVVQAAVVQTYNNDTASAATFDYSSWFTVTTIPANCPISQYYFSNTATSPVSTTISGANFVASTTTFTVDLPTWFGDAVKAVDKNTTWYLIAQGNPIGNFGAVQLNFEKKYKPCWNDNLDSITLNPTTYQVNFNNYTAQAIYDYSLWFGTSNVNCPITSLSFYFTTNNVTPVSETVAGVAFGQGTTFAVDFPMWFADSGFSVNTDKRTFLVAVSSPLQQQKMMEFRFTKQYKACWTDTMDQITLSSTTFQKSFNSKDPITTLDYRTWFGTNNSNCLLSQLNFFFSETNSSPTNATIAGVAFVASTTTFTVDFPTWYADGAFPLNTNKNFYLVAESPTTGMHTTVLTLNFTKFSKPDTLPKFNSPPKEHHEVTSEFDLNYILLSTEPLYQYVTPRLDHPQGSQVVVQLSFQQKKWLTIEWRESSQTIQVTVERAKVRQDEQLQVQVRYGDQANPIQGSLMFFINVFCKREGGCTDKASTVPGSENLVTQPAIQEQQQDNAENKTEEAQTTSKVLSQTTEKAQSNVKDQEKFQMKAQRLPWQGNLLKFDPKKHLDFFESSESNKSSSDFKKEQQLAPVKLKTTYISRNGSVTITFNQPLYVPKFIEQAKKAGSSSRQQSEAKDRKLEEIFTLDSIDVVSDILDVEILMNEEVSVSYSVTLLDWTEQFIVLFLNFTDPMTISKSYNADLVYFRIKTPELFRSKVSMKVPTKSHFVIQPVSIPQLIPHGISESDLDKFAENARKSFQTLVVLQLILCVCVKSAISKLWHLFFFLQIICGLTIYQVSLPVNAQILIQNFRQIIFFEILKPDNLLPIFKIYIKLSELLNFQKSTFEDQSLKENGIESPNALANLGIYIIIFALAVLLISILALVAYLSLKYRAKIVQILKKFALGFYWNNTIKSILVSYLPQCIAVTGSISLSQKVENVSSFSKLVNALILITLFVLPIIFMRWLLKHKDELRNNKKLEEKFLQLYNQVRLPYMVFNNQYSVLYTPFFLLRRFFYCLIPLVFVQRKVCQIQLLLTLQLCYTSWYVAIMPLETKGLNRLTVANELCILLVIYSMFIFAKENDFNILFGLGTLLYILAFGAITWNMGFIFYDSIKSYLRFSYLKRQKLSKKKHQGSEELQKQDVDSWEKLIFSFVQGYYLQFKEVVKVVRGRILRQNIEVSPQIDTSRGTQNQSSDSESQQNDSQTESQKPSEKDELQIMSSQIEPEISQSAVDESKSQVSKQNDTAIGYNNNNNYTVVNVLNLRDQYITQVQTQIKSQIKQLKSNTTKSMNPMAATNPSSLLPKNPVHFMIFPRKLPVTLKEQQHNKALLDRVDKIWHNRKDAVERQYLKEVEEREQMRLAQQQTNKRLVDKIEWGQVEYDKAKENILKNKTCQEDQLEFEYLMTIQLKKAMEKQ